MTTLSSIREQLFHYFKARIDAMFVDDIIEYERAIVSSLLRRAGDAMFVDDII